MKMRVIALFLTVCMLVMPVNAVFLTTESPNDTLIFDLTADVESGLVTAKIGTLTEAATVYAAGYTAEGKMISCEVKNYSASSEMQDFSCAMDLTACETVKLFLTSDGFSPVQAAVVVSDIDPAAQVLTAEKDAQLQAELQTRINEILTTETEIVHSDTYIPGETYTGTAYYISNDGDDGNDGLSSETAWRTLQAFSMAQDQILQPGDAIFFRRGDIFRIQDTPDMMLWIRTNRLTFSAYGEGDKPIITFSSENGTGAEKWSAVYDENGVKIWKYYRDMRDVSMVVMDNGEALTKRVYEFWTGDGYISCEDTYWCMHEDQGVTLLDELLPLEESMLENYNMISRPERFSSETNYSECGIGPLYLRCDEGNPGALYNSIEFSEYGIWGLIWLEAADTVFDNISFRCNGNSYIKNANNNYELVANTVIQNCEFSYGGGSVTFYTGHEAGLPSVGAQGDGIYNVVKNSHFENNYFHDELAPVITYEASSALTGYLSGSYSLLNNVMVNTMGIRLDASMTLGDGYNQFGYLSRLDLVEVRGNYVWNTGHMDVGKYAYSEGAVFLTHNHYGQCIIEDNVFYTTEQGHDSNVLLNTFIYEFETWGGGFTRPVLRNNTYVQYADRDLVSTGNQDNVSWRMDDPELRIKAAQLLNDSTSEFYIIP